MLDLQMRLNKVSELIHNSTNHQNLDSAGVSVHFQEIIDLVIATFPVIESITYHDATTISYMICYIIKFC